MGNLAETRGGVTVEIACIDDRRQELESFPVYDIERRPMVETTRREIHTLSGGDVIDRRVTYDTHYYNDSRIIRSNEHRWVWYYTMRFADGTTPNFMIQDQVGLRIKDYVGVIEYRWFGIRTREFLHIRTNRIAYVDDAPALPDRQAAVVVAVLSAVAVVMLRGRADTRSLAIGVAMGVLFHLLRCAGPFLHRTMRILRQRSAYKLVRTHHAAMVKAGADAGQ